MYVYDDAGAQVGYATSFMYSPVSSGTSRSHGCPSPRRHIRPGQPEIPVSHHYVHVRDHAHAFYTRHERRPER